MGVRIRKLEERRSCIYYVTVWLMDKTEDCEENYDEKAKGA